MQEKSKTYDLFLSYSTDPDFRLSRQVESFLESFHEKVPANKYPLKQLNVCRDGSDFELHKIIAEANASDNRELFIKNALKKYLQNSNNLLVLCSSKSAISTYVDFEIDWFIKNKPNGTLFLAVTEGSDLKSESLAIFPKQVAAHNILVEFSFDFRGFKKESASWKAVKEFDDEIVSLASILNGFSRGELIPIYVSENEKKLKEERKKLIKQRWILAIATIVSITLFAIAFIQKLNADAARDYAKKQKEVAIEAQKEAENNLRNYEYKKLSELIADAESYSRAGGVLGITKKNEVLNSANRILEKYKKDSLFSAEAIKIRDLESK